MIPTDEDNGLAPGDCGMCVACSIERNKGKSDVKLRNAIARMTIICLNCRKDCAHAQDHHNECTGAIDG